MNIFNRIKNIWKLSAVQPEHVMKVYEEYQMKSPSDQKAEFIMPNRTQEILERKNDVSIDEVLTN